MSELWSCWGQGAPCMGKESPSAPHQSSPKRGWQNVRSPCSPKDVPISQQGLQQDLPPLPLLYTEALSPEPVRWLAASLTGWDSYLQKPEIFSICCRSQTHKKGQKLTSKGSRRRRGDRRPAYTRPPSDSNSRCLRS